MLLNLFLKYMRRKNILLNQSAGIPFSKYRREYCKFKNFLFIPTIHN